MIISRSFVLKMRIFSE